MDSEKDILDDLEWIQSQIDQRNKGIAEAPITEDNREEETKASTVQHVKEEEKK